MAYDLEEQEQIDEFRAWWNKNGKTVTRAVIAVLVIYTAWQGYQSWLTSKSEKASTAYQALVASSTAKLDKASLDKLVKEATAIRQDYTITPYAGRAGLFEARTLHENGKKVEAKQTLAWVVSNAKEEAIRDMASIELAGLQIEDNDTTSAIKTLEAVKSNGFSGVKSALLGDIYYSKQQFKEAKNAYTEAVKSLDPEGKLIYLTQQKLDALANE